MMNQQLLFQIIIGLAGLTACFFFSIPAGCILLATVILLIIIQQIFEQKQKSQILKLCDKIDEILRGTDAVCFDEFREGELSILSAEIHKMTIRLREQNSALSDDKQFMKEALEDMSHQLRTPLTSMMLIAGILRKPELSRREHAEQIQELIKLLSQMQWQIEMLLKLSRFEAGAVTFQKSQIQMTDLIKNALEPLEISLELKQISVQTSIEGNPSFEGDMLYCTEAVMNILKNCMEHTPEGGTIRIHAFENAVCAGLVITDSGEGIPEQDLPHLFERFYRGSEFSRNGFGLGLAFAQKMIAAQHGVLSAKNAQPHGAEFEFRMYKITQI